MFMAMASMEKDCMKIHKFLKKHVQNNIRANKIIIIVGFNRKKGHNKVKM